MSTPSTLVIFEHIPKTAGSTMHSILWHVYNPRRVFMSCNPGEHSERVCRLATDLSTKKRGPAVFISHVGYGAHARLPEGTQFRHFTLLRDPVERTVSHYFYSIAKGETEESTGIREYIERDPLRRRNAQTLHLSGYKAEAELAGVGLEPDYDAPADALERAVDVLTTRMDAFGFTDRFDEALVLLRRTFDWPLFRTLYVKQNVNRRKPKSRAVSESDLDFVREANAIDIELYRVAENLYAQRRLEFAGDLDSAVRSYRTANRAYARLIPFAAPLMRPAWRAGRRIAQR